MIEFDRKLEPYRNEFLRLEGLASAPYNDFVYDDAEQSLAVRSYVLDVGAAEFAPPYGSIAREGSSVVGVLACLTGQELSTARLRTAMALARSEHLQLDAVVQQRVRIAARTLAVPQQQDFYLSRISVVESVRGHGVGSRLMGEYERRGREEGCARLILEVAADSAKVVHFYERQGFTVIDERAVVDEPTGRRLAYLHMAKSLLDTVMT